MRILGKFDRQALASFITVAIELLDVVDGDSDTELNGDEEDGNASEDDFMRHMANGPGCPIADSDFAVDDQYCDEPFQDLEPEGGVRIPRYGIDQRHPLP
jgi:hypothetical protein